MKKIFRTISGNNIELDISREACEKFGFLPGEKAEHSEVGICTAVGVAPAQGNEALWFSVKACGGRVGYSDPLEIKKIE